MTSEQKSECHKVIHTAALACAAGNAIPIPALGIATDILVLTQMSISLAAVFGANITEEAAKGLAMAALKKTITKQPIKIITKELVKLIPWAGSVVSASMSIVFTETTGWAIASELDRKYNKF